MNELHRVTTEPTADRVVVRVGNDVVADTTDALVLHETGLGDRYYLPRADVRMELLSPTDTSTHCPYKGDANYWSVTVGGDTFSDVAWSYEHPIVDRPEIAGLVCFYHEKPGVDLEVVAAA
jgi:uncharacterized protein (DUF427 family)